MKTQRHRGFGWYVAGVLGLLALLLLAPRPASAQSGKPECVPSDMLLVVDYSGSMKGQKWSDAKRAFNTILTNFSNCVTDSMKSTAESST